MQIDSAFLAMSHPARRRIVELLEKGDHSVGELSDQFPSVSRQAVYKHLRLLEQAGFIASVHKGRTTLMSLKPKPVQLIDQWVTKRQAFWEKRLMSLKSFVENEPQG